MLLENIDFYFFFCFCLNGFFIFIVCILQSDVLQLIVDDEVGFNVLEIGMDVLEVSLGFKEESEDVVLRIMLVIVLMLDKIVIIIILN